MTDIQQKNIQTVLAILNDEIKGDIKSALEKMDKVYSMTWVYEGKSGLFPKVTTVDLERAMTEAYSIKDRSYDIKNITASDTTVMVELVESYGTHRTPLVLVLELKDGKIIRGRHYCDPQLSHKQLTKEQLNSIFN